MLKQEMNVDKFWLSEKISRKKSNEIYENMIAQSPLQQKIFDFQFKNFKEFFLSNNSWHSIYLRNFYKQSTSDKI